MDLLGLGLKYIPTNKSPSHDDIIDAFKDYSNQIRTQAFFLRSDQDNERDYVPQFYVRSPDWIPPIAERGLERYLNYTRTELLKRLVSYSPRRTPTDEFMDLKRLLKRDDIVIKACDKNLGIAVLDRMHYINLVNEHLSDDTVYYQETRTQEEIIDEARNKLAALIPSIYQRLKNIAGIERYLNEAMDKTTIPAFHVIPKIHKIPLKGRPIAGAVNWLTTNASSILAWILKSHVESMPQVLRDSKSIIKELESLKIPDNAKLITMDVSALYPNMDQLKTIQIVHDLFSSETNSLEEDLTRFILTNSYVEFDGKIFKQIDGMAMGTNAAVQLANLYGAVMIEQNDRIAEFIARCTVLYKRYIDDLLMIWTGSDSELEEFYVAMNAIHPRLKFTSQLSSRGIAFLDLWIEIQGDHLTISTYQKTMNRYLYVPFTSHHPIATKSGLIKGELIRYARNSSTRVAFNETAQRFFYRLTLRGYPRYFIENIFATVKYENREKYLEDRVKLKQQRSMRDQTRIGAFFKITFHRDLKRLRIGSLLNVFKEANNSPFQIDTTLAYRKDLNVSNLVTRSRLVRIDTLSRHQETPKHRT